MRRIKRATREGLSIRILLKVREIEKLVLSSVGNASYTIGRDVVTIGWVFYRSPRKRQPMFPTVDKTFELDDFRCDQTSNEPTKMTRRNYQYPSLDSCTSHIRRLKLFTDRSRIRLRITMIFTSTGSGRVFLKIQARRSLKSLNF